MNYCVFAVITGLFVVNLIHYSHSLKGCITYIGSGDMKISLCTQVSSNFTRVPSGFPAKVNGIHIVNQNIRVLDSSQLRHLNDLYNLTLQKVKLNKVVPDSFKYLPQLKLLKLSNNNLYLKDDSLPRSSFLNLALLETLDLSNNPLGFVSDYYFQSLKQLKVLILAGGHTGFFIEDNGFYGLSQLRLLDLSNNYLTTLSDAILPSLSSMQLQEFYLYRNLWNCDCNLQWLKVWFSKQGGVKYNPRSVDNSLMERAGEVLDIQPICTEPPAFVSHNFLTGPDSANSMRVTDFKCHPQVLTRNRAIQMKKGQNVTLNCDFHANPGGSVTWSKNGMMVQKHWPRVSWGQSQGIRFQAWLTVTALKPTDSGNWKCILTNKVGKVNSTFALKVASLYSQIDFKVILKYVGIGAVTLILLLVVVGIIIYCVYGFQIQRGSTGDIDRGGGRASLTLNSGVGGGGGMSEKAGGSTAVAGCNKDDKTVYRVITMPAPNKPPCRAAGHGLMFTDSLDRPYYAAASSNNPLLQGIDPSTHSPFSHYLLNGAGNTTAPLTCPLHGDLGVGAVSPPDLTSELASKPTPSNPATVATTSSSTSHISAPCPLHGALLHQHQPQAVPPPPYRQEDYILRVSTSSTSPSSVLTPATPFYTAAPTTSTIAPFTPFDTTSDSFSAAI